ncbi:MAG: flagellar export chaperone FliS [Phycisphaeraceae bacterium]|nr:flagellar export chaperone FliS [Phycisphaeraceae bacterium]
MSKNPAANSYLRTKVMTSSPQQLRLMLFDGAIRFTRKGREAVEAERIEDGFESLVRAQKIVLELSTSLNHEIAPELCEKMSALYTYIYRLLVDANVEKNVTKIDEAIRLLEYERQTWQMFIEKVGNDQPVPSDDHLDLGDGENRTALSA